jgi:hypothetical protein
VTDIHTDPRWPGIRFSGDETRALIDIYRLTSREGCRCYDADGHEHQCTRCTIRHAALYASPAGYAALEPDLPRPPVGTTEESPF